MMGISFQPIYGGPAYAFRNVVYNCQHGPFKLHNTPWGAVMIHNTVVKFGMPWELDDWKIPCTTPVAKQPADWDARARHELRTADDRLRFRDYDGFGGYSGDVFLKWNKLWYKTIEDVRANAPVEKHFVLDRSEERVRVGPASAAERSDRLRDEDRRRAVKGRLRGH